MEKPTEYLDVNGRIILKLSLKNLDMSLWTEDWVGAGLM